MPAQFDSARVHRCAQTALVVAAMCFAQPAKIARADESSAAGAPSAKPAPATAEQQLIQKLIRDLGNSKYTTRRAAAAELRRIGPESFDLLHAATEDADPEIAASANYLLRQIAVRWERPGDPAAVRQIMNQFGQVSESARLQLVENLARLPQGAGIAALGRIARFDRSAIVSRTAALVIIRPMELDSKRPPIDAAVLEQELGPSTRTAVSWLRQYLAQLHDPPASIAAWKQLVEAEQSRLERSTSETSNEVVLGLLWNLADLYRQTGDAPSLAGALDEMMALELERYDQIATELIEWLTETKAWTAFDAFLAKHQERIGQNKLPMYAAAIARSAQGKNDEAEKLAGDALAIPPQSKEGLVAALKLEQRGQFEWAVREYRASIDKEKRNQVDSEESIYARIRLSSLFHDHERFQEAADVLEQLVKSVQNEGRAGQIYAGMRERLDMPEPDVIAARYHFYRAQQYLADKDPDLKRARGELDLAINFDREDADVLIAMYRFPEAEPKWRDSVRQRIRQLTDSFQQKIDQDPSNATNYNQWAWLVANTEGDFQKAVRYSHRSLELNTNGESGESSYLDTLGRCYYAAGDYENAVKHQKLAIEKNGHMQVMHRQLKEFEQALEQKKAGKK